MNCVWHWVCVCATHTSLLLFSGRTIHEVPEPTVMMWVLPLMIAGRRRDWNSQPHSVTCVSPPTGAVLGKNCRETETGYLPDTITLWLTVFKLRALANQLHLAADLPPLRQARTSLCSTARDTLSASSSCLNTSHSSWSAEPSDTQSMSLNVRTPVLQRAPWTSWSGREGDEDGVRR